ncbi:MAG: Flp family type IVb pilin [Pseudolabrys sp.]|jgi:Flp pilus assembly pilin Flp|nr:Flp family type IVb pilin [Pseudolabrys sp.]
MTTFFAFLKDDSGATAIEYGLLAAGRVILHRVSLRVAASVFSGFF